MQLTDEQKKDVQERMDNFRADYLEMVKKYDVDLVCFPRYVQNPNGAFLTVAEMQLMDKKYLPVPSPIQNPAQVPGDGDVISS